MGNAGVTSYDNKWVENADIVIRFNNYATRQGIAHLGNRSRCDVLFTTFDLHSQAVKSPPQHVVIGIPYPFHVDHIIEKFDQWYPQATPWMVNPYWNRLMCQELGIQSEGWKHPFPSIGFTALWHMHRLGINNNSDIYICGFNWYYDHDTKLMQGYKLNKQPRPTHFNHDYWIESSWIVKNLLPSSGYSFSPTCIAVLDKVKEAL